jgi:hypothetical protein
VATVEENRGREPLKERRMHVQIVESIKQCERQMKKSINDDKNRNNA